MRHHGLALGFASGLHLAVGRVREVETFERSALGVGPGVVGGGEALLEVVVVGYDALNAREGATPGSACFTKKTGGRVSAREAGSACTVRWTAAAVNDPHGVPLDRDMEKRGAVYRPRVKRSNVGRRI
jgi:hypothetical protein